MSDSISDAGLALLPEGVKIEYEDNHLIIAQKPPNMLTQGDATGDTSLYEIIKQYIKIKYNKPGEAYLGLVHRMDRPVGGLLCFARTSKAAARLNSQIKTNQMHRIYLAILQGELPPEGTLIDYLIKDMQNNMVRVAQPQEEGAKKAILHYKTMQSKDGLSLVKVELETGRSHQIRVQFANGGNALWGDGKYGQGRPGEQIALWGAKLYLEHPTLKTELSFVSLPCGGIWDMFKEAISAFE